jgi:GNAT superfamily N-acetyltransferase
VAEPRELIRPGDVERAAAGHGPLDGLLTWAAQAPGARSWRHGAALAVASPNPQLDRLVVTGPVPDAAELARHALAETGPSYRLLAEPTLIDTLARERHPPRLKPLHRLYWMDTTAPCAAATPDVEVRWLDATEAKATAPLFDRYFPLSLARPGGAGVRRWAGVVEGGEPVAVAADAWSSPGCGFVSGVLTLPPARGRGLARAVSGFLLDALVHDHGRVGLLVFAENAPAIATYERLGMTKRLLAAADVAAA